MIGSRAREALAGGQTMLGWFHVADQDNVSPGVLRWTPDDGAVIELVEPVGTWPHLGDEHYTVHGELRDGGVVTLLDAWTRTVALGDQVTTVRSPTLALGEWTRPDERWPRAIYSTANLSEWREDTGLKYHRPHRRLLRLRLRARRAWRRVAGDRGGPIARPPQRSRRRGAAAVRMEWRPPTRDEVKLPGMTLAFAGQVDTAPVGYVPDWWIKTRQVVVAEPEQPWTIDTAWRRVAGPLLDFTSFVSDRPDGLVREVMVNVPEHRQVEIWRKGKVVRPRDWNPVRGYLLRAVDLVDYERAIQRWWTLDERLRPALGLFAEHINHGNSYSPARFLTLHTAMEAYCRECHGQKQFRLMRDYAGVSDEVTACDKHGLMMIGLSRNYFAHLSAPGPRQPSVEELEDNTLETTRRAHALMQACLLRELGFEPSEVEQRLRTYYENWPLPRVEAAVGDDCGVPPEPSRADGESSHGP